MKSYFVIGGGLAGLTAANTLAAAGGRVTLIEQSEHLGGRARTLNGMNLGPHALYRGGCAARTFREWEIPYTGKIPPTSSRAFFVRDEEFYPAFANLTGLMRTRLFHFREKLEVANLFRLFASGQANAQETMVEWLDRHISSPRVRDFGAMITRISTFAIELEQLSASAALRQIASALKDNVLYLDGGWQTLVEGLAMRARSLKVEIRCGEQVRNVGSIDADGIVLALGPAEVRQLTGATFSGGRPVRMATLDLCLEKMPDDTPNVAFPVDRPLYLSRHASSPNSRMVHIAKYLGGDLQPSRNELEDYATLVMPRWRQHVQFARFLPNLTVTAMMPTTTPRPDVDCLKQPRIAIAGDWVGAEGMLSDAAVASALRAARFVEQRKAAAA